MKFNNLFKGTQMMKYKKLVVLSVLVFILSALHSCTSEDVRTKYIKNKLSSQGEFSIKQWQKVLGMEKANALIDGIGKSQLDLLSSGIGTSNVVELVNKISVVSKLITLIGNDFENAGSGSGLGALRVITLIDKIDSNKQDYLSVNITGSTNPQKPNQDTIAALVYFVNQLSSDDLKLKVIPLMNTITSRDLSAVSDWGNMNKLARLIAHVHKTTDSDLMIVINIIKNLSEADIVNRLAVIMKDVEHIDVMIEVLEKISNVESLIQIIETSGVSDITKLIDVLNVNSHEKYLDGTKLAYILNNISSVQNIIDLIDGIDDASKMGKLLHFAENGDIWTGQLNGPDGSKNKYGAWGYKTPGMPASVKNLFIDPPIVVDSTIPKIIDLLNDITNISKLTTIMNRVIDMNKMVRLVQDIAEIDDLTEIINTLPVGSPSYEVETLGFMVNSISLGNITRMRQLVDGQRELGSSNLQAAYISKMILMIEALDKSMLGVKDRALMAAAKIGIIVDTVSDMSKMINLIYSVSSVSNLARIINDIHTPEEPNPKDNSALTMAIMVNNSTNINKVITVLDNVNSTKIVSLVDKIACVSQSSLVTGNNTDCDTFDGNANDLSAAGTKLATVINHTSDVSNLVYIINNVTNTHKMATLVNFTEINSAYKIPTVVNHITGTNSWNSSNRSASSGMGKMVNMINYVSSTKDIAVLIDVVDKTSGKGTGTPPPSTSDKLSKLINNIPNSSNLVGLVNAVIAKANVSTIDMANMMIDLNLTSDIPKLYHIVNGLGNADDSGATTVAHADHNLIAKLLQAEEGFGFPGIIYGVGWENMVTLIQNLSTADTYAAADRIASLMTGLSSTLNYDKYTAGDPPTVSTTTVNKKDGLVRVLTYGIQYLYSNELVIFPGIGPIHIATMMNNASSASSLLAMMNSVKLNEVVVTVGCTDHVGENYNNKPNFYSPCSTVGLW